MDTTNGTSLLTPNLYMPMIQEEQINSAIKRDTCLALRLNVLMTESALVNGWSVKGLVSARLNRQALLNG